MRCAVLIPFISAIIKYHSLKMEEVNDAMRHLWNKTYQGTDIDGIMIRSEGEGGSSKRSYNYRVRRSPCFPRPFRLTDHHHITEGRDDERSSRDGHAGPMQRWTENARFHHNSPCLIRLLCARLQHLGFVTPFHLYLRSLTEMFGAALDEPTNALDAENVEALASSLVE